MAWLCTLRADWHMRQGAVSGPFPRLGLAGAQLITHFERGFALGLEPSGCRGATKLPFSAKTDFSQIKRARNDKNYR